SRNLTLNLLNSSRRFVGTVFCDPLRSVCNAPSNTFNDGWFVNIHQISNMTEGTTRLTQAVFTGEFGIQQRKSPGFNQQYQFRWCAPSNDVTYPGWCGQPNGSQV